jgi:hypothetical protein
MAEPMFQSHVAVLGLKETLRALDQMDARTRRETRKELYEAAVRVQTLAQSYVDPEGLSGWKRWKGGYEPARIAQGIRLTTMDRRGYGGRTETSFIAVVNSNVAGAIWELAGRKSDGKKRRGRRMETERGMRWSKSRGRYVMGNISTGRYRAGGWGNGPGFIRAIRKRGGEASRTVWAAYDQTDAGFIKRRIEQMLIREGRTTQRQIDMNPY